jgi:hypothetical protein
MIVERPSNRLRRNVGWKAIILVYNGQGGSFDVELAVQIQSPQRTILKSLSGFTAEVPGIRAEATCWADGEVKGRLGPIKDFSGFYKEKSSLSDTSPLLEDHV